MGYRYICFINSLLLLLLCERHNITCIESHNYYLLSLVINYIIMYIFTNGSILSHSTVDVREFVVILFIFLITSTIGWLYYTECVQCMTDIRMCFFVNKKRTGTGRSFPCFDWEFYLINILKLYIVLLSFIFDTIHFFITDRLSVDCIIQSGTFGVGNFG